MSNSKPYKSVLRLCSHKERSSREIESYLEKFEISKEEVSTILSKLKQSKIIDDSRFTRSKIRARINRNKWGKNRILEELKHHKIEPSIIKEHILQITEEEWNTALEYHIKYYSKKTTDYIKKKLYDYGFEITRILSHPKLKN